MQRRLFDQSLPSHGYACACAGPSLSRRRLLLAGAGATLAACASPVTVRPSRKIDVHHHFNAPGGFGGQPDWSVQRALDQMDRYGVAASIGYLGPIVPNPATPDAPQRRAREFNEFGAEIARSRPTRFGFFASLPMTNVEATLREIEHAFETLGADGVGIATNYGNVFLGDPRFEPIWSELNRRAAVVFVHPTDAPCCTPNMLSYEQPPLSGPWIEWPMNTARTILDLMMQGRFRTYPNIRFIFSHGGGMMPAMIGRIEGFAGWFAIGQDKLDQLFPDGIRTQFRKLYFECAQALAPENFAMVRQIVPDSQILFGSDFDRFSLEYAVQKFDALTLPPASRLAIESENALGLFPRFA